jgi:EAL domain-containing protein (putative c-di-GMP-specific phosphodiesterase class I)
VSAEALIRWIHPEKGMISPAEFIPLAEDTHLILPIGAWVLHEACKQIKAWDELGHKIDHIAVNVSSRQFRQAGFVQQVRQALLDTGVNAKRLVIELTEGCVIEQIDDTIAKMHALQAMGVRISIDDFGVGYSSLSYLKSLPLSQLKIDQSFVRHINDPNAAVIVETIIMMTKSLGLNVIAEGVEDQSQIDFLKAKGCLFYQGYFYGRPVAAEAFKFSL